MKAFQKAFNARINDQIIMLLIRLLSGQIWTAMEQADAERFQVLQPTRSYLRTH